MFLSTDPVKHVGSAWKTQVYAYSALNPLRFCDPAGLLPLALYLGGGADAGIGAAAGVEGSESHGILINFDALSQGDLGEGLGTYTSLQGRGFVGGGGGVSGHVEIGLEWGVTKVSDSSGPYGYGGVSGKDIGGVSVSGFAGPGSGGGFLSLSLGPEAKLSGSGGLGCTFARSVNESPSAFLGTALGFLNPTIGAGFGGPMGNPALDAAMSRIAQQSGARANQAPIAGGASSRSAGQPSNSSNPSSPISVVSVALYAQGNNLQTATQPASTYLCVAATTSTRTSTPSTGNNAFSSFASSLQSATQGAGNQITQAVQQVVSTVSTAVNSAVQTVGGWFGGLFGGGRRP